MISTKSLKILVLFFFLTSTFIYAQRGRAIDKENNPFTISAGINFIDSSGEQNPFNFLSDFSDEIAFSIPFEISVAYDFSQKFDAFILFTLNEFEEGQIVDQSVLAEDITYTAFDVGVNYYFLELNESAWQFFGTATAGVATLNDSIGTLGVGFGTKYWFTSRIGAYLRTLGKFAVIKDQPIQSNHIQYSLGVVVRI